MRRLTITLHEDERNALHALSQQEHRPIRMQVSYLIRQELERRGLLGSPNQDSQHDHKVPIEGGHDV